MTRRPDDRTRAQRASSLLDREEERKLDNLHRAIRYVAELNGSTSSEIRSVYRQDVQRGTGCKVVM